MRITAPKISFQNDSRGVSEVVGFLLIFAILVILLSINQAQFVPQENREVEFQHFQDVQDDMVDVRSAISTAGQTNVSQYPTVRLGTNYPTRLFAVNPPPPTGTLRTSQSYNISIYEPGNPNPQNVSTQFLKYQNGYNELDVGPIWYENSVLYLDERSNDGNVAVIEDQHLLTGNNDPVRITALQKNYTKSSTNRVAIEFYPAENPDIDLDELDGPVTIKIPTRLSEEYWDTELGEYSAYDGDAFDTNAGVNFLQLTVDIDSLRFNTVGINSTPTNEDSTRNGIEATPPVGTPTGPVGTPTGPTQSFVSEYNDNSNGPAPQNDSIPPSSPMGSLNDFSVMQQKGDGQSARLVESHQQSGGKKYRLEIGFAFRDISSGSHTLSVKYRAPAESFDVVVVDSSGTEIDDSTSYTLDSTTSTTEDFQLSPSESQYIDSNGEIYLVVEDNNRSGASDKTPDSLFVDWMEITAQ